MTKELKRHSSDEKATLLQAAEHMHALVDERIRRCGAQVTELGAKLAPAFDIQPKSMTEIISRYRKSGGGLSADRIAALFFLLEMEVVCKHCREPVMHCSCRGRNK